MLIRKQLARAVLLGFLCQLGIAPAQEATGLDRYIAEPDPSYSFRLVRSAPGLGYTVHVLEMTSQTWRGASEVDHPVWRHWMRIFIPSRPLTSTGFLLVNGGSNGEEAPATQDLEIAAIASLVGAVAAEIRTVPNQPLTFTDRRTPLSEDALISYTWDKFLRTGDERWPAQLPMTKAVIRALDTITAFCRSGEGGGVTVDKFVIAGASKRAWPTWLSAAVDRRVIAIVPLVLDALNMEGSFIHHWRTYGFWAPAVGDYDRDGIFAWLRTPQIAALRAIVDPYQYRDRLTMPKYIINSAGDQFFAPESSRYYFGELPGENFLRYVPNTGHELESDDVLTGGLVFFQSVISGSGFKRFSWESPPEGGIRLRTIDRPGEVRLWQATNAGARDFRAQTIGRSWTSTVVPESAPGVYQANISAPREGWSAYFLELSYPSGGVIPLTVKFTTSVRVVPDTLPFETPLVTLSAANYMPLVTAESFVSGFAPGLSTSTASATSMPLPASLGGLSIRVKDSAGTERTASLSYVSPDQINYLVPAGTSNGIATIEVVRQDRVVVRGQAIVESTAPGLFSADGSGRGIAAGVALSVRADGSQQTAVLSRQTSVSLGGTGELLYLALFGTGMRGDARATIGGESVPVLGPVPQGQYPGLDQVNLGPLPMSLARRGEVPIALTIGGKPANVVTVIIE